MIRADSFTWRILTTFLARGITVVSSIVIMIAAARMLGPEGKGSFSYLLTVIGIGNQFGNLGIGTANLYFSSRDQNLLGRLLCSSAAISLFSGAICFLFLICLVKLSSPLVPYALGELLLIAVAISATLVWSLGQNLLVGLQEIRRYNWLAIVYSSLMLVGMLLVFKVFSGQTLAVTIVYALCATIVFGLLVRYAVADRLQLLTFDRAFLSKLLRYGFSVYLAQTIGFLLIKCDFFVVRYFLGDRDLGLYSIAQDSVQGIVQLQAVINMLIFARLVNADSEADRRSATFRVARIAVAGYIPLALVLFAGAEIFVVEVFGADFSSAATAVRLVLPGAVALSLSSILQNHMGAAGKPGLMIIAPAVALVVNVVLAISLVPRMGIAGGAIASSCAYAVMLCVSLFVLLRR